MRKHKKNIVIFLLLFIGTFVLSSCGIFREELEGKTWEMYYEPGVYAR